MELALKTKPVVFNDATLTLIEHPEVGWGLPVKVLGAALDYSNHGEALVALLARKHWVSRLGSDIVTVTGEALASLKVQFGTTSTAGSLKFLTAVGVWKVLLHIRATKAAALRDCLASKGGDVFAAAQSNSLSVRQGVTRSPSNRQGVERPSLDEFKKLLSWMKKEGYGTQEQREAFAFRAVEQFLGQLGPAPMPAQLALPPGVKFAVTGNALDGDHPDFPGWLTAGEIAKPYGKTGHHFARIISEYCQSLATKLPNVQAKAASKAHGGQLPVDDRGFCVFVVPKVQGFARWGTNTQGMSLWSNVWGPDAVKAIRKRYEDKCAERGEPIFTQTSFPNMGAQKPDPKS